MGEINEELTALVKELVNNMTENYSVDDICILDGIIYLKEIDASGYVGVKALLLGGNNTLITSMRINTVEVIIGYGKDYFMTYNNAIRSLCIHRVNGEAFSKKSYLHHFSDFKNGIKSAFNVKTSYSENTLICMDIHNIYFYDSGLREGDLLKTISTNSFPEGISINSDELCYITDYKGSFLGEIDVNYGENHLFRFVKSNNVFKLGTSIGYTNGSYVFVDRDTLTVYKLTKE